MNHLVGKVESSDRALRRKNYVRKLVGFMKGYSQFLIVSVDNVTSVQMQSVRLSLKNQAKILMGKNTLIRKAIRQANNPALEKIIPHIKGNVGFVFTNEDIVEIKDKIVNNKVKALARAGAVAPCDVILPPQNTGLGPENTAFFQALQIPTRISKGSIEILNEIHLIKKEDRVGPSEATLLNMLNLSPFTYGIKIRQVYDAGNVFSPDVLDIIADDLRFQFLEGARNIASVSLEIGYPTVASIPHMLVNGLINLLAIAAETCIRFKEAEMIRTHFCLEVPNAPVETNIFQCNSHCVAS